MKAKAPAEDLNAEKEEIEMISLATIVTVEVIMQEIANKSKSILKSLYFNIEEDLDREATTDTAEVAQETEEEVDQDLVLDLIEATVVAEEETATMIEKIEMVVIETGIEIEKGSMREEIGRETILMKEIDQDLVEIQFRETQEIEATEMERLTIIDLAVEIQMILREADHQDLLTRDHTSLMREIIIVKGIMMMVSSTILVIVLGRTPMRELRLTYKSRTKVQTTKN